MQRTTREVVVAGSGPNGLAAAIESARAGLQVTLIETADAIGGGARSAELTLPGFVHDVCSAVHPLGVASPFFRSVPLADHGLKWITPPAALAHPFDDGTAVLLLQSISGTAETLDTADATPYAKLMQPLVHSWEDLAQEILAPLHFPSHPLLLANFGLQAIRSAAALARRLFSGERARAFFSGMAAHSFLKLEEPGTAAFGLVLGVLGHINGWPVAAGGSGNISRALADYLRSLGAEILTGREVLSVDEFPSASAILLDVTPRQILRIAGDRLGNNYLEKLRHYRYGPGVFKIDWALESAIPWTASECRKAGTIHLGGTMEEISSALNQVWQGEHPERPFVLIAQQSFFDPARTPPGKQAVWGYCHVPHGSMMDMTEKIENQIERFAPGFRDLVLSRRTCNTAGLEIYNANYIGGDINGGVQDLRQMFFRPVVGTDPYSTPDRRIFICSSSTPPGGGVHGMCGYHAARSVIARLKQ